MRRGKATVAAIGALCIGDIMIGLAISSHYSAGAILKATPAQFDAGMVAEGKTVEITTSVQNVGSTPVEITNVRTS